MVNHNNIFKKIGYILNELQDQYQFLSENPEQLSELELELFLANANFLTDHIQIVKKLTSNQPVRELPVATYEDEVVAPFSFQEQVTPPSFPKPVIVEEQVKNEHVEVDNAPTFEFILSDRSPEETIDLEAVVEDNHHEEQVDYNAELDDYNEELNENEQEAEREQEAEDIEEYDNEVTYVEPSIAELEPEPFLVYNELDHKPAEATPHVDEVVPEQPAPEPTLIFKEDDLRTQEIPTATTSFVQDRVEEKMVQPAATAPRPTLNDLLASQKANSFNQENTAPIVTDLKKAVNLNEKLLFIKDLFNGYNLAYSEAIDIINKLPDFKTADGFLQNNYAIKNNWQTKQATVDKFYGLLKQRFPEG